MATARRLSLLSAHLGSSNPTNHHRAQQVERHFTAEDGVPTVRRAPHSESACLCCACPLA